MLALDILPCLIFSRNILSTKTPSGVPPQHCSCVSSPGSLCIRLFVLRVSRCLLLLYAPSSAAVRPPSSLSAKGFVLGLFHPRRRSLTLSKAPVHVSHIRLSLCASVCVCCAHRACGSRARRCRSSVLSPPRCRLHSSSAKLVSFRTYACNLQF